MAAFNGKSTGPLMSSLYDNRVDRVMPAADVEALAIQAASKRGKSIESVKANLNAGDTNDITAIKEAELRNPAADAFNRAMNNSMDPANQVPDYMNLVQAKSDLIMEDPDYHRGLKELMLSPDTPPRIIKSQFRLRDISASIRDDAASGNGGFWNKAGDFLEVATVDWIFGGFVRDVLRTDEDLSAEIYTNSVNMSDVEWQEYSAKLREDARTRGVLGDNYFNQIEFADLIDAQGFDEYGSINQGIAVVGAAVTAGQIGVKLGKRVLSSINKPVTRVGNDAGIGAANEMVEEVGENLEDLRHIQEDAGPSVQNPTRRTDEVTASESTTDRIVRGIHAGDSDLSQAVLRAAPDAAGVSVREVQALASTTVQGMKATIGRPVHQVLAYGPGMERTSAEIGGGLADFTVAVRAGNQFTGLPLQERAAYDAAAKLRKAGKDAQAVPVDKYDTNKGWLIEVREKLDTTRITDDIDVDEEISSLTRRAFRIPSSARSTTPDALQGVALQGENTAKNLGAAARTAMQAIKEINGKQVSRIVDMIEDLNYGDNVARTNFWETDEFAAEYFSRYKVNPTEKEVLAYLQVVEVNDVAWMLKADDMQFRLNNAGYVSVDYGEEFVPSKSIGKRPLTQEDRVYDIANKRLLFGNEIDRDTMEVFEMWLPKVNPVKGENGPTYIKLVVNPKSRGIKSVGAQDALPYNPGGTRRYKGDARFFITVDGLQAIATAPSRKLAQQMSKGIDEIMIAARKEGIDSFEQGGSKVLDDLIAAKSGDWMPDVKTWEDFRAMAKNKRWTFSSGKVSFKADNEAIEGLGNDDFWSSANFGDYVEATGSRSSERLLSYGGNDAVTYDPITAISMQLQDGITQYSHRGATQRQMADWLKMADVKIEPGESIERAFKSARMDSLVKNPRTSYLKHVHQTIARRGGQAGPITTAMQQMWQDLINNALDLGGAKWARGAGSVLNTISQDNFLRVGFLSAFVFNPAQYIVQASWVPGIIAISPVAGLKGASMSLAIRAALHAPDEATALARLSNAKMAKMLGLTKEEIEAVYRFQKRAGSDIIDAEALDKGTDAALMMPMWKGRQGTSDAVRNAVYGTGKGMRRAEEIGMVPFNEGERLNRLTAHSTAVLEWIKKNPERAVADVFNDTDIYKQVLVRADDLSANMTTVSRGQWQSGAARVPTQWLSFSMRMLEMMTFGKQLGRAEKARLWGYFAVIGGMTGFGVFGGDSIEKATETLGFDPGTAGYTAIKFGLLDAMVTEALEGMTGQDVQTGLGPRLAPLTAITDFIAKITDGKFAEVIGGPSGEIGGGGALAIAGVFHAVFTGDKTMARSNIERAIRTPSFIDNPWKAYGMMKGDAYTSKTGTQVPLKFSPYETAMIAAGLGSGKVNEWYSIKEDSFKRKEREREVAKQAEKYQERIMEAIRDKDYKFAADIAGDLNSFLEFSGLSAGQIYKLRRSLVNIGEPNEHMKMLLDAIRGNRGYEEQRLLSLEARN